MWTKFEQELGSTGHPLVSELFCLLLVVTSHRLSQTRFELLCGLWHLYFRLHIRKETLKFYFLKERQIDIIKKSLSGLVHLLHEIMHM